MKFLQRLYYREHRLLPEVEDRYPSSREWKSQIDAKFDRRIEIPVGWLPVLAFLARQQGIDVEVRDWARIRLPLPDLRKGFEDREFIRFVAENPSGIIRIDPQKIQIEQLLRQLLAAWPRCKTLVVVRSVDEAVALYHKLKGEFRSVDLVRERQPKTRARQLIGAANGIGRWQARLEDTEIVLVTDAELLVGGTLYEQLRDYTCGRIYGLLPAGRQLVPYAEDRVTSLLGFDSLTLWHHWQVNQPVFVRTLKNKCGRHLNSSQPGHVLHRGIWKNERRNWMVADEARQQLARLRQLRAESGTKDKLPWIVGVVVENAYHAARLASHLRDWPVEHEDLAIWITELITSRSRRTEVASVICTLDTPGFEWLTTIIRADAGPGCGISPQSVNVYRHLPLVIIDIRDRHHPTLKTWRNQRVQAYREAGFVVNRQPPQECMVQKFVLQHPPLPRTS